MKILFLSKSDCDLIAGAIWDEIEISRKSLIIHNSHINFSKEPSPHSIETVSFLRWYIDRLMAIYTRLTGSSVDTEE